jgi:D-alanyl-D-alanine dipeptidase
MSSSSASPTPTATPTHSTSPTPAIPPLGAAARAANLVDIRTVVPDAIIDLRYATTDNFTHVQLYPANARCMVHESMVAGLRTAAARLRQDGYRLVFWDCYRPHAVQVHMFRIVPNPEWVARPGNYATSHESARSVDVTLASQHATCAASSQVHGYCLLDMGTGFDDFTARAHAFATNGVSTKARDDRAILRHAMEAGKLTVYSGEWWHFDVAGSTVHRPILNVPVTG